MSLMAAFVDSYAGQTKLWEQRVAAGTQPQLPLLSGNFLVCSNVVYLGFTLGLYLYMKAQPAPLQCRPFKGILLTYNFTCVVLAGYVVWGIGLKILENRYSFVCNETVTPRSPADDGSATFLANVFWVFYAQKFWEFLDTWFFIMRKSFRQVTFLHVFHHCSINIVVGMILPFEFNGDMYLPILLNAFVHVLMYSHYLVSALGFSTPWKSYLTSLQLAQFVTIAAQSWISLSKGDSCGGPYFGKVLMVVYMGSMLVLFGNFFVNTYILKSPSNHSKGVLKRPEEMQVTKSLTGSAVLDANGCAKVEVPQAYACAKEIHYQITPVGRPMPNLHVQREPTQEDCSFVLDGGGSGAKVSWTVTVVVTLLSDHPKRAPGFLSCCSPSENGPDAHAGLCCQSPHPVDKKQK